MLDGPSHEHSPDQTLARAVTLRTTRQAARRRPTVGSMMMMFGTTVEQAITLVPPRSSNECWTNRPPTERPRRAAVRACPAAAMKTPTCPNNPRCLQQPDRALFLLVAAPEIEMLERAPPCDPPRRAKQHGAAMNTKKAQQPE